jgi:hypothetical protein
MVEKLLNIEQFFIENSFKSKLKIIREFEYALGSVYFHVFFLNVLK